MVLRVVRGSLSGLEFEDKIWIVLIVGGKTDFFHASYIAPTHLTSTEEHGTILWTNGSSSDSIKTVHINWEDAFHSIEISEYMWEQIGNELALATFLAITQRRGDVQQCWSKVIKSSHKISLLLICFNFMQVLEGKIITSALYSQTLRWWSCRKIKRKLLSNILHKP